MRLIIRDDRRQFNDQTHAYAEYRTFAALAAAPVEDATVTLALNGTNGEQVTCAIDVRLRSGEVLGVESAARFPYAAIDGAVRLLVMGREGRPVSRVGRDAR